MKNTIIAAILLLSLSGCGGGTFIRQRWPILPEIPAPQIEQISRSDPDTIDKLVRNFNKVGTWGREQETVIKTYNKTARKHNATIK